MTRAWSKRHLSGTRLQRCLAKVERFPNDIIDAERHSVVNGWIWNPFVEQSGVPSRTQQIPRTKNAGNSCWLFKGSALHIPFVASGLVRAVNTAHGDLLALRGQEWESPEEMLVQDYYCLDSATRS